MSNNQKTYQIAIDGPSGAGKSSIAKCICDKLGFTFINTGAMYRCYALALIRQNVDLNNIDQVMSVINNTHIKIDKDQYFINIENVTDQLHDNTVALMASKIGTFKEVREKCVAEQQKLASGINCVMEGRDTTSVVLPNATLKVYLDADVELRALRRFKQINEAEPLDVVRKKIIERDHQDMNRAFSPLTKVKDAFVVYDKNKTIEEVSDIIIAEFKKRVS
ncbi:MAG: (d)CMP kinase [Mycoplasma sp.]